MRIYNFLSDLSCNSGGVLKVMMDINDALNQFETKTMSFSKYNQIIDIISIPKENFVRLTLFSVKKLKNSIIITHERRYVIFFAFLRLLLRLKFKIIYVHHNEMHSFNKVPFPADAIVAISDAGIRNLVIDLNINESKIHKIHNCARLTNKPENNHIYNNDKIKLLLPAKISEVKQQIEIVRHLKDKISDKIQIVFAGGGDKEDINLLKKEIKGYRNFEYIGFQRDILELMVNYDYVLLFSKHEGLPISQIEATMVGCPIVTNNVGGCPEIVKDHLNGFIANDWDELISVINNLPNVSNSDWQEMSNNSKKIYNTHFTFEKFREKYVALINSL